MNRLGIAAAAAIAAGAAFADTVTLKGGSVLVGETGTISGDTIKFKSDDIGELNLKLANIKSIDKAKNHTVQYTDGTTADRILVVKDGELWSGDAKLDMSKVKKLDPVAETWHGSINVAYNAARGNQYENSAAVLANVNRRWEKDRLTADFAYNYSESGKSSSSSEKTSDRWLVDVKHDHFCVGRRSTTTRTRATSATRSRISTPASVSVSAAATSGSRTGCSNPPESGTSTRSSA